MKIEDIYRTSRDYEKLYELLEAGQEIVCIVDYKFNYLDPNEEPCRDICKARKCNFEITLSVRGLGYGVYVFNDEINKKETFVKRCQVLNVAWVDPLAPNRVCSNCQKEDLECWPCRDACDCLEDDTRPKLWQEKET